MIDINLIRNKETRDLVKKSEKNRFRDPNIVDEILKLDEQKIKIQYEYEQKCKEINQKVKDIKIALKNKEDKDKVLNKYDSSKEKEERNDLLVKSKELEEKIYSKLNAIGNVLDNRVPVHKTEDGNITVRQHNTENLPKKEKAFSDLMSQYTNSDAGAMLIGHRGYYLEGKMAQMATALKFYALNFLTSRGYTAIQTPVMMRKDIMGLTAQLSDFDEQLYHVTDGDAYLIATSEQPLTALFYNKRLQDEDLPKIYAGESLCFRKEAGAHGKDNAGIFRVHQFEKIEQFVLCKPEESDKMLEKMIGLAEEFYKTLGISFRTVLIASGEMNDSAAMKYDLEAWFPNAQKFRELVSASNCTDYQSRNLNVYYGYTKKEDKPKYVHMLNATLCAVQRALCCIVENYQEDGKIIVPEVLKKYLDFDYI
ncbi:Serine--tRNA [Ecytonucleospora hepatopenaei]|uniref:serine--tRNA ligase n=1 Tax=Ecytonucleospora hepatopenaei TaxID=646526 RepID=A0A1W0E9G5_9MICR|nr:Serine--tRNA [Ecytonucleospora hepatopenaei]